MVGATPSGPFVVLNIDGLGPTEHDVVIDSPLYQDGVFKNRTPKNRQIIARVGLQPNYSTGQTASDLRDTLYELLMPGGDGSLIASAFNGATEVGRVSGWVSKCEPLLFSKDPEVLLTIECLSAYLSAPTETSVTLAGLSKTAPVITNPGTAPSGLEISLTFTGTVGSGAGWTITDDNVLKPKKMKFFRGFVAGDILIFNTNPGKRDAKVNGASLLNDLTDDSDWLVLHKGTNTFTTSSSVFNWNYVKFTSRYLGI